jgi:DNA-binding NarL/FixJ family response regulator
MSRAPESASVKADRARAELLTAREREVLQLLAHGHTNREVADRLHISLRTAEWRSASVASSIVLLARLSSSSHSPTTSHNQVPIVGRP